MVLHVNTMWSSDVGFPASDLLPHIEINFAQQALPLCSVLATAVSEDMVAAAAHAVKGMPNVSAMIADAQNLAEFQDNSVDVVTCCYG